MLYNPTRTFSPRQYMGDRGIVYSGDRVQVLPTSESFDDFSSFSAHDTFLICPQPLRPKSPSVARKDQFRLKPREIAACKEIEQILSPSRRASSPDLFNFGHLQTPTSPTAYSDSGVSPSSFDGDFRPQLGESVEIPEIALCQSPIQRTGSAPVPQIPDFTISANPPEGPISSRIQRPESPVLISRPRSTAPAIQLVREPFVDPPTRCSNPIVINEPFVASRGREDSAEIGLLSVSPTPMSMGQIRRSAPNIDLKFPPRRKDINSKSRFRRFDVVTSDHHYELLTS
eukprot:TRINITY_DN9143_c0_g2_i1.p1 TRINITY_DN9143_c0_g2~~TRINITY_DN9143_c0_g2_i1.p1  ORF type:complete len:286 (+),score=26.96 TRINITY_DN9143_c0_g2_i1:65-922(+)